MSRRKFAITSITTILACGVVVGVFSLSGWFGKSGAGFSSQLLPEWKYRRPITLSGQTSNLTDYQVKIELTASLTSSLVSAGKLQSDFDDIRFTDANDNQLLNFWIETATTTATSTIWVKVPGLSASKSSTIYLYYGNPSAASASSGANTFEFFDDFNDGNYNGWAVYGGAFSASNGYLSGQNGTDRISTPMSYVDRTHTSWEYKMRHTPGSLEHIMRFWHNAVDLGADGANIYTGGTNVTNFRTSDIGRITSSENSGDGGWHKFQISRSGNDWYFYWDGKYLGTYNEDLTTGSGYWMIQSNSGKQDYDDVRVRKYASPEPAATLGDEQTQMTPVAHWRFDEGTGTTTYDSTPNNLDATLGSSPNDPEWITQ